MNGEENVVFIKHCRTGQVLHCLYGPRLTFLNMHRKSFRNADLRGRFFRYVNFAYVDFTEAVLDGVFFEYADLNHARLSGQDLSRTRFLHCNLQGTYLGGVKLNWHCGPLVAEVLRRRAQTDRERMKIVGFVSSVPRLTAGDYARMQDDTTFEWVREVLAPFAKRFIPPSVEKALRF